MSIKIYLVKHLDTGMGYVGITGDELGKRWYQHLHDPKGALYAALRAEGHRMSMQLLEEVETRAEALAKEQEYIHALGTAQPAGWNRDVRPLPVEEKATPKPKVWKRITRSPMFEEDGQTLVCPCECPNLHQETVEVYQCYEDSAGIFTEATLTETTIKSFSKHAKQNPSSRRNGLRIFFSCEWCHNSHYGIDENGEEIEQAVPPLFELTIAQHKGITIFQTVYYIEDKS